MEVLKDEICFECKKPVPALEVYREGTYIEKRDIIIYKFFHLDCAKEYCKRQKSKEGIQ